MMYFNSLDNPLDDLPVSNKEIRSQVNLELKKNGLAGLFNKLRKIDPVSAKKINQFDTQRIQRAMEVFYLSGKPLSAFHSNSQKLIAVNATLKIGLFPSNRESLNKLIEKRVEYMLRVGLIDEVRGIVKDYPGINDTYSSIRSVGYRQTYQFLDNQILEEDLKDKIIFATRQLAKRQMTWMRKMQNLESFDPFDSDLKLKIKKRIQLFLK
jgi:tRNA dimethylallyltransferase